MAITGNLIDCDKHSLHKTQKWLIFQGIKNRVIGKSSAVRIVLKEFRSRVQNLQPLFDRTGDRLKAQTTHRLYVVKLLTIFYFSSLFMHCKIVTLLSFQ